MKVVCLQSVRKADCKKIAELLGLYDPKFPEEAQCGGYHTFKRLMLGNERIPENEEDMRLSNIHVLLRKYVIIELKKFKK